MSTSEFLNQLLDRHLNESAQGFRDKALDEIAQGARGQRFAGLLSMASRYAKRQPLALTDEDRAQAEACVPGWSPGAWNRLELVRAELILARPDLEQASFAEDFETLFRYADEGETCAFYRILPLLPAPERFVSRAAEGCRTNMLTVFEAIALDSPYPVEQFDDTAWHQLVIKALFLDLPVYRIVGLDQRLTEELTRMALDWADERASAGRSLYLGLWLCLGPYYPARVAALVRGYWASADARERQAMALAMGRTQQFDLLVEHKAKETDDQVQIQLDNAREGRCQQTQFAPLFEQV